MKYLCLAYYDVPKLEALSAAELAAIESQCPPLDAALTRARAYPAGAALSRAADSGAGMTLYSL